MPPEKGIEFPYVFSFLFINDHSRISWLNIEMFESSITASEIKILPDISWTSENSHMHYFTANGFSASYGVIVRTYGQFLCITQT